MVLVFGSLLEWAGGSFPDLLVLRLVVVPRSHFGIGGAVTGLWRIFFQLFTVLLLLSRQLWLIIYVGIWGPCMGMLHFVMAVHDWELAMLTEFNGNLFGRLKAL